MRILNVALATALAAGACTFAQAPNLAGGDQNAPHGQGGWQGRRGAGWAAMGEGRGILGTVTAAAPDHFLVKTDTGDIYTVHFSVNTRIVRAREWRRGDGQGDGEPGPPPAIKAAEIKVGDAITAGGEVDPAAKSVGAVAIVLLSPEQARQMREIAANFGKTWLAGRVTAVDGVKVTLQGGPGNATHSFVADENTTFRKRREPITLADVQMGDAVRVEGAVKDGIFTATAVVVMLRPSGEPPERGQPN